MSNRQKARRTYIEAALEALLEETRKKISEQLSMVGRSIQSIDPTLYDKEEELEQAIAILRERDEEESDDE
jgi:hypothetical protein